MFSGGELCEKIKIPRRDIHKEYSTRESDLFEGDSCEEIKSIYELKLKNLEKVLSEL